MHIRNIAMLVDTDIRLSAASRIALAWRSRRYAFTVEHGANCETRHHEAPASSTVRLEDYPRLILWRRGAW